MIRWPLPARTDLRDRLLVAWSTDRGYHDVTHLSEVVAHLTALGAGDDPELLLAAWYHDAVYDAAPEPEERSARLAESQLAGTGADVAEVARLVRLTAHHRPAPEDRRGALLVDADLAILAAPPERYAAYVAGVRQEYADLSDDVFRPGRAAVLRDLLTKPTLFHSARARALWEDAARANVARELTELA